MTKDLLICEMTHNCVSEVTHIDRKGYVYCRRHAEQRKMSVGCRLLKPAEIRKIENSEAIRY
jgi:hypothetical protein